METLAFKLAAVMILILIGLMFGMYLTNKFTLSIDLNKAFTVTPSKPTSPGVIGTDYIGLRFRGDDGGYVNIVMDPLRVSELTSDTPVEDLAMTRHSIEQIENSLDEAEFEKWERLASLPTTFFSYNLLIYSDPQSPNNGKKDTKFVVKSENGDEVTIFPGDTKVVGRGFKFKKLDTALSSIELHLVTRAPIINTFYDNGENFVPQSTGIFLIRPDFKTQLLIIGAAISVVVALWSLVKNLALAGKDARDIINYYFS